MKVAVFLPNWIGDAVMATPALQALRDHFRDAQLIGVLKPYVSGVLAGGGWLDHQILANGKTWSQSVLAVAWQLRRLSVDVAVLFPNSFRSALTAWLGGCKRRIGYDRYARGALLTDAVQPLRDDRGGFRPSPILDAYNRLAEQAGCLPPGSRMRLFTTLADEAFANGVWEKTGLHAYREIITLNPGAAFGASKCWPASYFAEVARTLASERDCGVLVLCGPTEREMCRSIVAEAAHPAVVGLADFPLSLGLTKACVRRSTLLLTTDSGPRHFAAAFGRPVVTLFGPTHIAWTETYHPRALHLQKAVPCGPCQQRVCPEGHHRCMQELLPAEVLDAIARLLPRGQVERASA